MGLLDDAIREHLELKRKRGADLGEIERQEREVLGEREQAEFAPTPDAPGADAGDAPVAEEPGDAVDEPVVEADEPVDAGEEPEPFAREEAVEEASEPFDVEALEPRAPAPEPAPPPPASEPDPWLEEERDEVPAEESLDHTPDFLQETPEHDRLWFEQRPPRDFDWDK